MDAALAIRTVSFPWAVRAVRRHIGELRGVENLPLSGSFILAPNHSSYFDHFLTIIVTELARGVPLWILTKKESFEHGPRRAWTDAWYGIPVDRDRPGPSVIRTVSAVLARGDGLGIYPEGTRGPGDRLLPFKDGAFRLALKNNVPVLPVAIRGANRVLPPGALRMRPGRVDIAFGQPLYPSPHLPKDAQSADLAHRTRIVIEALLEEDQAADRTDGAAVVDRLVTEHLDEQSELSRAWIRRLRHLARLYLRTRPGDPALRAQLVRLTGLEAGHLHGPQRLLSALRVRVGAERILQTDPEVATEHYVLGRWHLAAPAVLGARVPDALHHFIEADRLMSPSDTRGLIGCGDALERLGRSAEAVETYRSALERLPSQDPRSPRRAARLHSRLAELEHAHA